MTDHITITGVIGTEPELRTVRDNLSRLSMRVATSERRRDAEGNWHNSHTNWFTVTAFGKLADNAHGSLHKGQRIVCSGKLRLHSFQREDGSQGMRVEIVANNLGPDLVNQRVRPEGNREPQAATHNDETPASEPAPEWTAPASAALHDAGGESMHEREAVLEPAF